MPTPNSNPVAIGPIGGFWVRVLARLLDLLVWGFTATLFAVGLVYVAPNTFGLGGALPEYRQCQALTAVPPAIPVPQGLVPNAVVLCAKSFFGVHFRNDVTLIERHTENGLTWHKTMAYAVDKDLQPKDTFDVDIILWLGFFAYVVAAQATDGATLGKRAMR